MPTLTEEVYLRLLLFREFVVEDFPGEVSASRTVEGLYVMLCSLAIRAARLLANDLVSTYEIMATAGSTR
tara:strand:- start:24541 stop:24750 length:210 start_codon:yes stop_codon:yes gene_type:complete